MKYTIDSEYAKSNFIIEGTTLVNYIGEPEPEELYIPDGIETLAFGCLSAINKLNSLHIPPSLKYTDESLFSEIEFTKELPFPKNVYIENLENYLKIEAVDKNASVNDDGEVISICPFCFGYDSSLFLNGSLVKTLFIPADMTIIPCGAFAEYLSIKNVVFPPQLMEIGDLAFSFCKDIEKITLPDTITKIGEYAFRFTGLCELILPPRLSIIAEDCFRGCEKLTRVVLNESLFEIRKRAFEGCFALFEITIPKNVVYVDEYCFDNCTNLKTIYIHGDKKRVKQWNKKWKSGCKAKVKFI